MLLCLLAALQTSSIGMITLQIVMIYNSETDNNMGMLSSSIFIKSEGKLQLEKIASFPVYSVSDKFNLP
jgi:hypothetical protein